MSEGRGAYPNTHKRLQSSVPSVFPFQSLIVLSSLPSLALLGSKDQCCVLRSSSHLLLGGLGVGTVASEMRHQSRQVFVDSILWPSLFSKTPWSHLNPFVSSCSAVPSASHLHPAKTDTSSSLSQVPLVLPELFQENKISL